MFSFYLKWREKGREGGKGGGRKGEIGRHGEKGRERERGKEGRWRKIKRSSICKFTCKMTTKAWAGPGWSHQPGKQGRPPMLAAGIGVLSHRYCSPGCAFTGSRIQNWDLKLGNFIMWCRHSRWHLNPSPPKNKVLDKDNTNGSYSILWLCIIYTIHISDEREKSREYSWITYSGGITGDLYLLKSRL